LENVIQMAVLTSAGSELLRINLPLPVRDFEVPPGSQDGVDKAHSDSEVLSECNSALLSRDS
jgi:hypothetical protein